ncbi:PTS sugar transporter subunit IIA [Streptococcus thoraltensis]|uniref:PTS sugar transporter subunit IIA n=1 Tax=Streptococcus thoraltensis TaxID=55085 RepID=UPI00035D0DFF|nr:PTS sugar transporter subunit IIA [Streptococcus thoraltensis]MDY4761227.1 PTS sugar transporter subunit IIA [Streptococcus thoraltensis]
MTKIIVLAHGNFPSGILSSLELIAGKQENIIGIDFLPSMSSVDLKDRLLSAFGESKRILILTDLLGGTPFNVASTLSVSEEDRDIKVLSGLNLAMLIEAVFARDNIQDLESLTEKVLGSAQLGISEFSKCLKEDDEQVEFEGGI